MAGLVRGATILDLVLTRVCWEPDGNCSCGSFEVFVVSVLGYTLHLFEFFKSLLHAFQSLLVLPKMKIGEVCS